MTEKARSPDPMAEPWWTLATAAAWIIWRTPETIRTLGPKLRLSNVLTLGLSDESEYGARIVDGNAARSAMWHALGAGELRAEGIRTGDGGDERAPIRDAEWIDLEHFHNPRWPSDALGRLGDRVYRFRGIRVHRVDLVRLWPVLQEHDDNRVAGERGVHETSEARSAAEFFAQPTWDLGRTLSWIAYRDPARTNSFRSKADLRPIVLYDQMPNPGLLDRHCQQSLHSALVEGRIAAVRRGERISWESWVGASLWDFDDALFRRADVLDLWAEVRGAGGGDDNSERFAGGFTWVDEEYDPVVGELVESRQIRQPRTAGSGGRTRSAIRDACAELWPDGLPNGLRIQERDRRIIEWFKSRGLTAPSDRTIRRALNTPPD